MKKLILLLILLFTPLLFAADSPKLTEQELIEVEEFFADEVDPNDTEGHTWLRKLHNRRQVRRPKLRKLRILMRRARAGEIDIGRGRKLRMKRIKNITRLNRKWSATIIKECARGLRCPLDLTLHSSRFGVAK